MKTRRHNKLHWGGSPPRSKSKTQKNDKEFLEERTMSSALVAPSTGASAKTIDDQSQIYSDEKAAPKSSARAEFIEESPANFVMPEPPANFVMPKPPANFVMPEPPANLQVVAEIPHIKASKTRKKREKKVVLEASAEKPKKVRKSRIKKAKEEGDAGDEGDDEGETQCEVDGRLIACVKNNKRERLLWECFKGEREITDADLRKSFSCQPIKVREMVDRFTLAEPLLRSSVVQIGGQGNNYDYTFMRGSQPVNIELKTNAAATKYEKLERVPWCAYGQLIQIFLNVKNEKYKPLFQSFDSEGMIRHWFDTVVMTEIVPKYGIEGPITYESYCKFLFHTTDTAKKLFTDESMPSGTVALFRYFHAHREDEDDTYRGDLWKRFTRMWMETHRFDPASLLELIKSTLNKKDIWICTTKRDAYIIPGPKCAEILPEFKEIRVKDASIMVYNLILINGTTGEEFVVEFKLRFYWKNGGQGVHNLCLQVS